MAHREFLAKLSSDYFCVVNPNPKLPWSSSKNPTCKLPLIKTRTSRPNLVPRSSSQAEIELVTLARPGFKLPMIASSHTRSFVLSSPNASFKQLLVDEKAFSDSPVVV